MLNGKNVNFKQGKEARKQLELPTLHFIVTDQWTDILSEKAIFAWLKMYSWCKRDIEDANVNLWEQSKIPLSFTMIKKKLKVGNDTFYNKILKPLWNVGLIDIEEYDDSDNKGTKPMNIIVYKYPQNNKALAYEPIENVRNYDKDYHSNARTFAKKGGRPKKQGGSEVEHPPVPKENTPLFSNRTPGGSEIEHINTLNSISNNLNFINNTLNSINKIINSSSYNKKQSNPIESPYPENQDAEEEEKKYKDNPSSWNQMQQEQMILLIDKLTQKGWGENKIKTIIKKLTEKSIFQFTTKEIDRQVDYMNKEMGKDTVNFHTDEGFAIYFVNGIEKLINQSQIVSIYQREQMIEQKLKEERSKERKSLYYNWLEEA